MARRITRSKKASLKAAALAAVACASTVSAQTYRRAAACPSLGCVYPPDQTEFIAGQVFDIRIESHAPLNGTQAYKNGVVADDFALYLRGKGATELKEISQFYNIEQPKVESYNFTYYEDLFAEKAETPTLVNVKARQYDYVTLYNPGTYELVLKHGGGLETLAEWEVKPLADCKKAKNVILFVGDGMAPSMVTAARMLGHKSINGRYQSKLMLDQSEAFGMQMTHSIDSFITDSANSATALMAGHKSTVNALNAYTDSTGKYALNPSFETVFEMGRRIYNAKIGIVTTAYLADATPAATCAHTAKRSEYDLIIDQFLSGVKNKTWSNWDGPDVIFGSGGRYFMPNAKNGNVSQIDRFVDAGYKFVHDNATLSELSNTDRALGIFSSENLPTWLDRHIFKENLPSFLAWNTENSTFTAPATNTPGLKEMTLKALDILVARGKEDDTPFMMMSEAASIDKAMHIGDYHRALGDLLELDNTVAATIARLKELGIYDETLVVVTADHAHGFDVYGGVDTEFLVQQPTNSTKRAAVGTYGQSGLSAYQVPEGVDPSSNFTVFESAQGHGFPVNWTPRYTIAAGFAADVDQYEDYTNRNKSRVTSVEDESGTFVANIEDAPQGFFISGSLPVGDDQGVHSLVDVGVYSWGAGHELFAGMQNSIDIGLKIAQAMDLGRDKNVTYSDAGLVKSRSRK